MNRFIDQYLLFRVRTKQDADAFARLYDRYVTPIYRFVYLKLPSKEMAEEVASETFLRCWQYIQEKNDIGNIRALLYRIARNLVVDTYRKQKELTVSALSISVTFSEDGTSTDSDVEFSDEQRGRDHIEARAEMALVLAKISRLKEDFQDVLTLRLVDGLGFDDIASILEKTPGNVRVIYHRAMKVLEGLRGD